MPNINPGGFKVVKSRDGLVFKFNHDLHLHILSDIHYGNPQFDQKLFDYAVEMIKADKNAKVILGGDTLEAIPPHYKISQRGQEFENDDQMMAGAELLSPLKSKILFTLSGNHTTDRFINVAGIDLEMVLAKMLNVPYYGPGGFVKLLVNKAEFLIATSHGSSVAKNGDLELERMKNLYVGADVYILGHDHKLYCKPVDMLQFNGEEHLKAIYFCRAGSFLKYPDYARKKLLPIIRSGWVELIFKSDGRIEHRIHTLK